MAEATSVSAKTEEREEPAPSGEVDPIVIANVFKAPAILKRLFGSHLNLSEILRMQRLFSNRFLAAIVL